jgi:hypothetical protein
LISPAAETLCPQRSPADAPRTFTPVGPVVKVVKLIALGVAVPKIIYTTPESKRVKPEPSLSGLLKMISS